MTWPFNTEAEKAALRERTCPKCRGHLEVRPDCFYSRVTGYMDGLYCPACPSLWDDPDRSFIEANIAGCKREREAEREGKPG